MKIKDGARVWFMDNGTRLEGELLGYLSHGDSAYIETEDFQEYEVEDGRFFAVDDFDDDSAE